MGWKMVDHRLHQWLNLSSHLRLVFTDYLYLQYNIQVCRVEPRWSISIFRLSSAQLQRVWKWFFYPPWHGSLARALGWKVKYFAYFGGLNRWDHPRNTKTKVRTHIGDSDSSWTPALALADEKVSQIWKLHSVIYVQANHEVKHVKGRIIFHNLVPIVCWQCTHEIMHLLHIGLSKWEISFTTLLCYFGFGTFHLSFTARVPLAQCEMAIFD